MIIELTNSKQDLGKRDEAYDRYLVKLETKLCKLAADEHTSSPLETTVTLRDYMDRIIRGTNKLVMEDNLPVLSSLGARCAVIAIEYVERAAKRGPLDSTPHELFLVAFIIAFKYVDDFETDSGWWSHVGGVLMKEIAHKELDLCSKLDWNLAISSKCFSSQRRRLSLSGASMLEVDFI